VSTASQSPSDTAVTPDTQHKLKQSLEQSGFNDVIVVPAAFVIHAKAPDGLLIVMEVSPDQMQGVIERTGSSSPPSRSSGRQSTKNEYCPPPQCGGGIAQRRARAPSAVALVMPWRRRGADGVGSMHLK
jgi:hypothetical protein